MNIRRSNYAQSYLFFPNPQTNFSNISAEIRPICFKIYYYLKIIFNIQTKCKALSGFIESDHNKQHRAGMFPTR